MDASLPAWRTLVQTFLEEGFRIAKDRGDIAGDAPGYEALARDILERNDLVSAATIGRYLHGEQREDALKRALYLAHPTRPRPGRIVQAISAFAAVFGPRLKIVTTNFDDLIEDELDQLGEKLRVRVVTRDGLETIRDDGTGSIEITHLHGLLPYADSPRGSIVLDDEDYAISSVRPPGEVLPDILTDDPTLFVGLSMTDPDLVAACYLAHESYSEAELRNLPWFGLFVGESAGIPVVTRRYVEKRLDHMGIHPVRLASYGQISQILYEAIHRRGLEASEYWSDESNARYGTRFMEWRRRIDTKYPGCQGGDHFDRAQGDIHDQLGELVETVRDGLPAGDPSEFLAAHLWVRRPNENFLGDLELWGSSAHLHRTSSTLRARRRPIEFGTQLPAVDSIYFGSVNIRNLRPDPRTNWGAVLAIPVELWHEEFENLLVGTISISSNKEMHESVLRDRDEGFIDRIQDFGEEWLTP